MIGDIISCLKLLDHGSVCLGLGLLDCTSGSWVAFLLSSELLWWVWNCVICSQRRNLYLCDILSQHLFFLSFIRSFVGRSVRPSFLACLLACLLLFSYLLNPKEKMVSVCPNWVRRQQIPLPKWVASIHSQQDDLCLILLRVIWSNTYVIRLKATKLLNSVCPKDFVDLYIPWSRIIGVFCLEADSLWLLTFLQGGEDSCTILN